MRGISWEVRIWRPEAELRAIEYADYWNDIDVERTKEWWVENGDFAAMEEYLAGSGLAAQLDAAIALAERIGRPVRGIGADLAAGALWAVPQLLRAGAERVYAVEYSLHRLLRLGPLVLERYQCPRSSVVLCQGSFYEVQLPDDSLDFVLLAQALHHADRPEALLEEVRRLLHLDGVALVIGEHQFKAPSLPRRLARRPWRPPPDPVLGDHYYATADYARMFSSAGLDWQELPKVGGTFRGFVLLPHPR